MSVVTSAIIDSAHPTYVIISRARACGPVISWPVMSFNTNKSDRFKIHSILSKINSRPYGQIVYLFIILQTTFSKIKRHTFKITEKY